MVMFSGSSPRLEVRQQMLERKEGPVALVL